MWGCFSCLTPPMSGKVSASLDNLDGLWILVYPSTQLHGLLDFMMIFPAPTYKAPWSCGISQLPTSRLSQFKGQAARGLFIATDLEGKLEVLSLRRTKTWTRGISCDFRFMSQETRIIWSGHEVWPTACRISACNADGSELSSPKKGIVDSTQKEI